MFVLQVKHKKDAMNIKALRSHRNWSQADLAERSILHHMENWQILKLPKYCT